MEKTITLKYQENERGKFLHPVNDESASHVLDVFEFASLPIYESVDLGDEFRPDYEDLRALPFDLPTIERLQELFTVVIQKSE